jgi:hypothetical protein
MPRGAVTTGLLVAALAVLFAASTAPAQQIELVAPEDGGTPRDPSRIERLGPAEFHVRASFEDGGASVLKHAVSRVDLVVRNDSDDTTTVTVHLDLSQDGKRTAYSGTPEAGMPDRDFAFIQTPGKPWRQIKGHTDQWVATVSFDARPGETRLGLSPWYNYAELQRFIKQLPASEHLSSERRKTDAGREHWELVITDPSMPACDKRTVFWHAREHAYETFSSFAMEGLVEFLLSDDAADVRRRYIVVLHPTTNVDGVAEGFEYRGGYDFPDPRGASAGRITFEAVDRLRPDFAVAWHNWIAPRDRNVVFYTDDDQGEPTPRAWLRLTQLLPSLHAANHRWRDETTPLKYNWHGRQPLNEGNVHQYAMKRYATRVWGWEMPWWNVSTNEARQWGRAFGRAFFTTIDEIEAGATPAVRERADEQAAQWDVHEFAVQGRSNVANSYRDAGLVGEFTAPSGKVHVVDGFHDGGDAWRVRMAFDEQGRWTYLLRGEGVEVLERGSLDCGPPRTHGFIRIHPDNPYAFAHDDGTPLFPMGDTCYGLFDDSPISPQLRDEYLRERREQRFNFVRLTVGHSESRAAADPDYWAWGGSPDRPDLDRYNPAFFRRFDAFMRELRDHGMNVEMILLNFYRRPYTMVAQWTPARERQWLAYLTARYAAFDNVFLWTVANEYETHPDGAYRLDRPADVDWARDVARFVKQHDPHRHLTTVHPVVSASARGGSPRDAIDEPWRIGEFFGNASSVDVLSQQTGQFGEGTRWDEERGYWVGDSATLVQSIAADRRYGKPVLNSENGYEFLRGDPTSKRQVHSTGKVRRSSWRIVCAGGWFAAGFHGTLGHSDAWNRIDPGGNYRFEIKDEGAAGQLRILYEFFTRLPYWKLAPMEAGVQGDAVALADPGKLYVAYLPQGGTMSLDLSATEATSFTARWFDPRTGEFGAELAVTGGGRREFIAPNERDWTLLIEALGISAEQ